MLKNKEDGRCKEGLFPAPCQSLVAYFWAKNNILQEEPYFTTFLARLYFSAEELLLYRRRPRPHAKC